jgi:four helix bundle protein
MAEIGRPQSFRDLVAWQRNMDLVAEIYNLTREWPATEQFCLTSQVRRAAVSVPSNIAEGHGRTGAREYLHHASIAFGSLCEVETQLLLAQRLSYLDMASCASVLEHVDECRRLLRGLLRSLRAT